MRLKAIIVLIVALMMVTLGLASCGEEAGEKVTKKIGLTAPLSGVSAQYGKDIEAGVQMAIERINEEGGITIGDTTYVFELVSADDEATPEPALSNAQRFILEEDIKVIFDPVATSIQPLIGINEKAGEEFIMMAYTSVPLYTEKVNKYMITMPPPFASYIKPWITLAMGKGWTKLGMVQTTGAYGDLWGKYFEQAWTGAGGTVVAKAPASYYTESDFTPYLTTVLAANPDVIFCGGPSDPTALVIDQARGLGFTGGFIVIDQAKLDFIADTTGMEKLEGAIGVLPVADAYDLWPFLETFNDDYVEKYGGERTTWESAIAYSGTMILARAMDEAQSVDDVEAIRAAFNVSGIAELDGAEYPVGYQGINPQTGALFMPATATICEDGVFLEQEPVEWWKE
ncbi:MAG: ABC transporter substrate-binding protein [Actinomycetota bacterium]|nr:ABC transporter substrate-binding protein [Actinomycetota bacterium]MDD5666147.1 ABC transporter substrate-binding protein [Actinomycetota bacterium]